MDAVALASVVTSGIVGLSGTGVALWTSRMSASLGREARIQQRLAEAYVEVLGAVEREGQWIDARGSNLWSRTDEYYDGPGITVPKPDPSERSRVAALLGAFGSKTVRQRHHDWLVAVAEIEHEHDVLAWNFREDGGDPDRPIDPGTLVNLSERLQPGEAMARLALADAIAAELGHR